MTMMNSKRWILTMMTTMTTMILGNLPRLENPQTADFLDKNVKIARKIENIFCHKAYDSFMSTNYVVTLYRTAFCVMLFCRITISCLSCQLYTV